MESKLMGKQKMQACSKCLGTAVAAIEQSPTASSAVGYAANRSQWFHVGSKSAHRTKTVR